MKLLPITAITTLLKKISETIDNVVNNTTEKEQLRTELFKLIYQIDMSSESWLSKNIRPLTLLIGLLIFVLFAILDGWLIEIKEVYSTMLGKMIWSLLGFYFGLRELGKQIVKRKK